MGAGNFSFRRFCDCTKENVSTHSTQMVEGMLGLLSHCPQEVAHLRKELLIAAGHILAIDLRNSGWHSNELVLILLISCLSNVSAPDSA
ncbi:hypothetical protein LSAT2_022282 [Lamellibrachia satsuma]|nr:hypothetical protein LSAT2_022282 [Lamellibrachia satsuma]